MTRTGERTSFFEDIIKGETPHVIQGPQLNEKDITALPPEILANLDPSKSWQEFSNAIEILNKTALIHCHLLNATEPGLHGFLLDKKRQNTPLFDFMMLLVGDLGRDFIHSIFDLSEDELGKILHLGEEMLSVFQKKAGEPILGTLSFNYHAQPWRNSALTDFLTTNKYGQEKQRTIKTAAQTLSAAHLHISALTKSELEGVIPARVNREQDFDEPILINPLTAEARINLTVERNLHDPMMKLVCLLLNVPSMRDMLLAGFQEIQPELELTTTGIFFRLHRSQLDKPIVTKLPTDTDASLVRSYRPSTRKKLSGNTELAIELQLLQSRLEELYNQVVGLLLDGEAGQNNPELVENKKDDAMPQDRTAALERIGAFIEKLSQDQINKNNVVDVARLSAFLLRFAGRLQNFDIDKVKQDQQQLFLRSFACTLVLFKQLTGDPAQDNQQVWQGVLAPRIVSTGNALEALNLVKILAGQVDSKWLKARGSAIDAIKGRLVFFKQTKQI